MTPLKDYLRKQNMQKIKSFFHHLFNNLYTYVVIMLILFALFIVGKLMDKNEPKVTAQEVTTTTVTNSAFDAKVQAIKDQINDIDAELKDTNTKMEGVIKTQEQINTDLCTATKLLFKSQNQKFIPTETCK